MTKYSVMITKVTGEKHSLDAKHSVGCADISSSEELDKHYKDMKNKYNATDVSETTMGHTGSHGLFKKAEGTCQHGKKVIIESNAIESMGCR